MKKNKLVEKKNKKFGENYENKQASVTVADDNKPASLGARPAPGLSFKQLER